MTVLRTARLTLRPLAEDDLGPLIELDADPEVIRFAEPGATPGNRPEALAWTLERPQLWIAFEGEDRWERR